MLGIIAVSSFLCIPSDRKAVTEKQNMKKTQIKMDYLGTAAIIPALILIVFAITDGSHAPNGWATPYVPVTFVLGWMFFATFIYIEGWVAEQPLLPFDMFDVKGMKPLGAALFLQYGTFGIFIFYASF